MSENTLHAANDGDSPQLVPELDNFSLVLGGPLYQLFRRLRLEDQAEDYLRRRIFVLAGIAWIPLLLLCLAEGTLFGGVAIPFIGDIETHVRFLLALPLLVVAELVVHLRMRGIVAQFLERRLVSGHTLRQFRDALLSAMELRNSTLAELLLLAIIVPVTYYLRADFLAPEVPTWYARLVEGGNITLAGYWYWWVSNPLLQFLVLRWYFRLFIWARFLWRVSRIELALLPTHPDRAAGLGFLGESAYAQAPLLAAHGAAVAGLIANHIFHEGASLAAFKLEIVLLVLILLFMVLLPLCVFAPAILAAKRQGLREYGRFASHYMREFDRRWLRSSDHDGESMLGSGDMQSLADLGTAFCVIREIKAVPFGRDTLWMLLVATLAPIAPLVFTMIPLEELLNRLIGAVF